MSKLRWSSTRGGAVLAALAVTASCAVGATAAGEQTSASGYKVAGKWGGVGTTNGKFMGVKGLAVDKAGNVYVADSDSNRIQSFSPTGSFKQVFKFGADGTVPDVAIGPDGAVWGTTQVNTEVHRFPAAAGTPLTTPKSAEGIAIDADGNVYVSTSGDDISGVVRFDKSAAGWEPAKMWVGRGIQAPGDVEVSPDGSIYVADTRGSPPNIKRYDPSGKLLKVIKLQMQATAGAAVSYGIGVDHDCNVWATNSEKRNVQQYSPAGKLLGAATSGDMIAYDIAFGRNGDFYVFDQNGPNSIVRFAEDRAKPARASVGGVTVSNGVAKVKYTLNGVACPSQLSAVASLSGAVKGKASVKVAAGKSTLLSIPVKGTSGAAQFKIVLKTNGRPTTQTAAVRVG